jgi:hypothetical protein
MSCHMMLMDTPGAVRQGGLTSYALPSHGQQQHQQQQQGRGPRHSSFGTMFTDLSVLAGDTKSRSYR